MENRLITPIVVLINYKNDLQNRIDFPEQPILAKVIERIEQDIADTQEAIEHLREIGKPIPRTIADKIK